jgi:hypothetical protein
MLRRDLISAEIEKLAQVLARIIGLKQENKLIEAEDLYFETLENGFGLKKDLLFNADNQPFKNWLEQTNITAEQLNLLSDFLYSELDFDNKLDTSKLFGQKLILVYEMLSNNFQIVHLINMGRQKLIEQYI